MKHIENSSIYEAAENCLIVRKADGFIMGDTIDLGSSDDIENYEDKEFSEEEINNFYESLGIEPK